MVGATAVHERQHRRKGSRGFTLIECLLVCAVVAVLASIALPSYLQYQLRAARSDAVNALSALQTAQEMHRTQHGMYATDLQALQGVRATSPQGRYTLALQRNSAESYRATALASGVQSKDQDCPALTLDVNLGFSNVGPSAACWRR